jgi:excinuclease UvrABC nuclease subunit
MHLGAPAFIRFVGSNAYPRITVTNRVSHRSGQREADWAYGPFQSRAAAERFADEALKLFLLRRCTDELDPNPAHPGCVYSEMKMCLAPCYQGCTDERYGEESASVESFLATRGESRLVPLRTQREQASAELEFETAAQIHAQVQKIEAVRALAPEIVRPLSQLRAVVLQASAHRDEVSVFLFEAGLLRGPQAFSTLGMRIQNEQAGSTSLFAQPMAIEPIPERTENRDQGSGISANLDVEDEAGAEAAVELSVAAPAKLPRGLLETRLESVLAALAEHAEPPSPTRRQGHLALLKRWYYRPEVRRTGEIFFPDGDSHWPIKPILRGIGRVAAKSLQIAPNS